MFRIRVYNILYSLAMLDNYLKVAIHDYTTVDLLLTRVAIDSDHCRKCVVLECVSLKELLTDIICVHADVVVLKENKYIILGPDNDHMHAFPFHIQAQNELHAL